MQEMSNQEWTCTMSAARPFARPTRRRPSPASCLYIPSDSLQAWANLFSSRRPTSLLGSLLSRCSRLAAACRWPVSSADKGQLRSLPLPSSSRPFASPAHPIIKSDPDLLKMTIPPPVPVLHVQTPLVYSSVLSERTGHSIFFKLETDQVSGSFKMRGIGAACQAAKERTGENVHLVVASGQSARTLPCSQAAC